MRIDVEDDSTGKRKVGALRHRSALLTAALLVGVCLGVIVSEKVYLITQEAELPEGAVAAVRSRKLEVAASGGAATLAAASGGVSGGPDGIPRSADPQPRNELEALLRRVAPQGEVMIAIRWALSGCASPGAASRCRCGMPARCGAWCGQPPAMPGDRPAHVVQLFAPTQACLPSPLCLLAQQHEPDPRAVAGHVAGGAAPGGHALAGQPAGAGSAHASPPHGPAPRGPGQGHPCTPPRHGGQGSPPPAARPHAPAACTRPRCPAAQCVQRLPSLTNFLVVAIDQELAGYCKEKGINHYHRPVRIPDSQKDTGSNHAISAMKVRYKSKKAGPQKGARAALLELRA